MSVLVLACGNPLREDDGVGWLLADAVDAPDAVVWKRQQLELEMAEDVGAADAVLFLDSHAGGEPGQVTLEPVAPAAAGPFTHAFSPEALLFCAERLYGRAPRALRLTVAGERFGHGEGLSEKVERALPDAVRQLREVLAGGAAAGALPR